MPSHLTERWNRPTSHSVYREDCDPPCRREAQVSARDAFMPTGRPLSTETIPGQSRSWGPRTGPRPSSSPTPESRRPQNGYPSSSRVITGRMAGGQLAHPADDSSWAGPAMAVKAWRGASYAHGASDLSEANRSLTTVAEMPGSCPTRKRSAPWTRRLLGHESDSDGMLAGRPSQAICKHLCGRIVRTSVTPDLMLAKAGLRRDRQPRPDHQRRGASRDWRRPGRDRAWGRETCSPTDAGTVRRRSRHPV